MEFFEAEVDFWGNNVKLSLTRTLNQQGRGISIVATGQSEIQSLALSDSDLATLGHSLPSDHRLNEIVWLQLVGRLSLITNDDGMSIVFCPEQGAVSEIESGDFHQDGAYLSNISARENSLGRDSEVPEREADHSIDLSRLYNSLVQEEKQVAFSALSSESSGVRRISERYHSIPRDSQFYQQSTHVSPFKVGDHNLLLESSEFMLSQVKMEKTQLQRQVWEGQRERAGLEHQLKMLRQELADKDTDIADIQAAKSGKIKKNRSESS